MRHQLYYTIYREIPWDTMRYREMPRNISRYHIYYTRCHETPTLLHEIPWDINCTRDTIFTTWDTIGTNKNHFTTPDTNFISWVMISIVHCVHYRTLYSNVLTCSAMYYIYMYIYTYIHTYRYIWFPAPAWFAGLSGQRAARVRHRCSRA